MKKEPRIECPIHMKAMTVQRTTINCNGTVIEACVALCPNCKNKKYINTKFGSSTSFSIDGIVYEYITALNKYLKEQDDYLLEQEQIRLEKEKKDKQEKEMFYKHLLQTLPSKIYVLPDGAIRCPEHSSSRIKSKAIHCSPNESIIGFTCPTCNNVYIRQSAVNSLAFCSDRLDSKYYNSYLKRTLMKAPKNNNSSVTNIIQKNSVNSTSHDTVKMDNQLQKSKIEEIKGMPFSIPDKPTYRNEIACVTLWRQNKIPELYYIVGSLAGNPQDENIIPAQNGLSSRILSQIAFGVPRKKFEFQKEIYQIEEYQCWERAEVYIKALKEYFNTDKPKEIIAIQIQNTALRTDLVPVTALVFCAGSKTPHYFNVFYSTKRDLYYISYQSYQVYAKRYGLPYLKLTAGEGFNNSYWNLRENSELNLYGYSVSKQVDMLGSARRELLSQLMDNELMSKTKIIHHLEWLINMHKDNDIYDDACKAWQDDLFFVNNYKIHLQRIIWANFHF